MTKVADWISENRIFVFIALFYAVMSLILPTFASTTNLVNIARDVSITGMVSCAVLMLIVAGYFDLSVGAVLAFAAAIASRLSAQGASLPLVFGVVALVGALLGALNALVVLWLRVNSLIATLSMMFILRGLVLFYTQEKTIIGMSDSFMWIGQGTIGPVPALFVYFVGLSLLGYLMLAKTVLGRHLYIVGANPTAAFLAGIRLRIEVSGIYVFVGVVSALCGILYSSRYSAASPVAARGMELTVIAAIIIGGANLSGGKGTIPRTIGGVALVQMIRTGLDLSNVDPNWGKILEGFLIAFAVAYDKLTKGSRHQAVNK